MSLSARQLAARAGLLLLGLCLGIVATELVVARIFPVRRPILRLHPELLHEPIPGSRRVHVLDEAAGGRPVPLAFDERGLRVPFTGPPPARHPERPLVLVAGDSLVLAESVTFEETFVERLGEELGQLGLLVDMRNAGVSGHGPDQTLLRLERLLPELRVDHLVLVICAHNDHGDLVRNQLFALDGAGGLQGLSPVVDPILAARWKLRVVEGEQPALLRVLDLWKERRAVARARQEEGKKPWIEWYLEAGRREWQEYASGAGVVHSLLVDPWDADVVLRPEWPSSTGKRALARATGQRLGELCRDAGIGLTVVVAPSAVDLDPEFRIRVDQAAFPSYVPSRQTEIWCEDLAALEPIDLHPAFAADPDPGSCFIGDIDFHWSARGQSLAARAVAPAVLEALQR